MKDKTFLLFILLILAIAILFGSLNSKLNGYSVKTIRCDFPDGNGVEGSFSDYELQYYCQEVNANCYFADSEKKIC